LKIIKVEIYKLYNPPHTGIYKGGAQGRIPALNITGAGRGIWGIGRS
jgi:hypothetical protein